MIGGGFGFLDEVRGGKFVLESALGVLDAAATLLPTPRICLACLVHSAS